MAGLVRSYDFNVPKGMRDNYTMKNMGVTNDEFDVDGILDLFEPPAHYDTKWFKHEIDIETDLNSLVSCDGLEIIKIIMFAIAVVGGMVVFACLCTSVNAFVISSGLTIVYELILYLIGVSSVRKLYVKACTNAFLIGYLSVYANVFNLMRGEHERCFQNGGNMGYDVNEEPSKTSQEIPLIEFKADTRFRTLLDYGIYAATTFEDAEIWLNLYDDCYEMAHSGRPSYWKNYHKRDEIVRLVNVLGKPMVEGCNSIIKNDFRLSIKKYYDRCEYLGHLTADTTFYKEDDTTVSEETIKNIASELNIPIPEDTNIGFKIMGGEGNTVIDSYPHNQMASNVVIERPEPKKAISLKKPEIRTYTDPATGEVYRYRTNKELEEIKSKNTIPGHNIYE